MAGLEQLSKLSTSFKGKTTFYLAAAVSDFYMPDHKMAEHKIQSRSQSMPAVDCKEHEFAAQIEGAPLEICLEPVPKLLGLIKAWNPTASVISFKLETDETILESKALGAISKYGVDLVVANLL